jgi:hypothetical protein
MRFRSLVVVFFMVCLSWSSHVPRIYPHGPVVFTLVVRDGLVMAADGLTTFVAEKGNGIAAPYPGAAQPKIAICGRRFLCGMAGVNPFPTGLGINYDFQKWITTFSASQSSPQRFANLILVKARDTFREFGSILQQIHSGVRRMPRKIWSIFKLLVTQNSAPRFVMSE